MRLSLLLALCACLAGCGCDDDDFLPYPPKHERIELIDNGIHRVIARSTTQEEKHYLLIFCDEVTVVRENVREWQIMPDGSRVFLREYDREYQP